MSLFIIPHLSTWSLLWLDGWISSFFFSTSSSFDLVLARARRLYLVYLFSFLLIWLGPSAGSAVGSRLSSLLSSPLAKSLRQLGGCMSSTSSSTNQPSNQTSNQPTNQPTNQPPLPHFPISDRISPSLSLSLSLSFPLSVNAVVLRAYSVILKVGVLHWQIHIQQER